MFATLTVSKAAIACGDTKKLSGTAQCLKILKHNMIICINLTPYLKNK